jgi:hypothetical protein
MSLPPLPNAILGGAQKCGTTTLHRLLERHPRIFFPPRPQEIHFFDFEASYRRGLDWYRGLFAGWRGEPVVAQTSPLYLYEPKVPARLAAAVPEAKLVFLLRNPIDRAYSHYWHEVRYGWESLPFEAALDAEPGRLRGGDEARRHASYLDRGRYGVQLARFLEHFPREQLLVLRYDALARDAPATAQQVAAFLGVSDQAWDTGGAADARHNEARLPRLRAPQRWVRRLRYRLPALAWLVDRLNLRAARYPPMALATRERLRQELEGETLALERSFGLDVSDWFVPKEGRAR